MPRLEQGVSAREDDITGSVLVYARCFGTFTDSSVCPISVWEDIVTSVRRGVPVWPLLLSNSRYACNLSYIAVHSIFHMLTHIF